MSTLIRPPYRDYWSLSLLAQLQIYLAVKSDTVTDIQPPHLLLVYILDKVNIDAIVQGNFRLELRCSNFTRRMG